MANLKVEEKQQQNIFAKMHKAVPGWMDFIDRSFLTPDFKKQYKIVISERMERVR